MTGSGDMKLTKWDLVAGKKLDETPAHAGDVCSMSLFIADNIIVTGSVDRCIKVWDVRTFKCHQTFFGHEADVNSVCVSNQTLLFYPIGRYLNISLKQTVPSFRQSIRLWLRGQNGSPL